MSSPKRRRATAATFVPIPNAKTFEDAKTIVSHYVKQFDIDLADLQEELAGLLH
jgi:hypothetical protein